MRDPRVIASAVLCKLAEDSTWHTPQLLGVGAGAGLGAGLLGSAIYGHGDYANFQKLKAVQPRLQQSKDALTQLLKTVRKQNPGVKTLRDRTLVRTLLENHPEQLSPQAYLVLNKGRDEGLRELSRNLKQTAVLRKRLLRKGVFGVGLGLGAGIGGGLLTAVGLGKFDSPAV